MRSPINSLCFSLPPASSEKLLDNKREDRFYGIHWIAVPNHRNIDFNHSIFTRSCRRISSNFLRHCATTSAISRQLTFSKSFFHVTGSSSCLSTHRSGIQQYSRAAASCHAHRSTRDPRTRAAPQLHITPASPRWTTPDDELFAKIRSRRCWTRENAPNLARSREPNERGTKRFAMVRGRCSTARVHDCGFHLPRDTCLPTPPHHRCGLPAVSCGFTQGGVPGETNPDPSQRETAECSNIERSLSLFLSREWRE